MKYILLISLFIVGCGSTDPKSQYEEYYEKHKQVDINYCINSCLRSFTSELTKIDSETIKEFKLSCDNLYKHKKCCERNRWNSYRECEM